MYKKKRAVSVLLPLFASVAIVGAGFSTWYFTNGASTPDPQKIALQITGARHQGSVFSFSNIDAEGAEKILTLDQDGISYSEDLYLGFGYVAETENRNGVVTDDNFQVEFQHGETDKTPGANVYFGKTEENGNPQSVYQLNIATPGSATGQFTVYSNSKNYTIYYLIYTNLAEAGSTVNDNTLFDGLTTAVKDVTFTDNDDVSAKHLADFDFIQTALTVNALPELTYESNYFDVNNQAHYEELKSFLDSTNIALYFSTYVDVASPSAVGD